MLIAHSPFESVQLQGLLLGCSLVSTDVKVLGYDEGIKLWISYGKVFVTILVNLCVTILGIDVGTELGSLA